MKKIILVNQVTGPMFIDIANYFQSENVNVHLVTGAIEKTGSQLKPGIHVTKLIRYRRKTPITRIYTWVWFTLQAFRLLKHCKETADVLLVSNPPFVPLLGYYLRKKKNLTFRALIYDIYPDVLETSKYFTRKSFLSRWWRSINVKSFNNCSRLFTISHGMKEVLSQYASPDKWEVVYPWVDTSFIKPISPLENIFRMKYKLENKIVILYSGNMGHTHDLMTVMKAALAIQDKPKFFFLFIGDGSEKQRLVTFARTHRLRNVLFLPFQDPDILPSSLSAGDIGLVTLSGAASEMSIPSKSFYQMAAGNSLLCVAMETSELAKIVLNLHCGVVIPPGSVNQLVEFLTSLTDEELKYYQENSRLAAKQFSTKNISKFR